MPTFSSDGVDIHYQVAGEGYPLVLSTNLPEISPVGSLR